MARFRLMLYMLMGPALSGCAVQKPLPEDEARRNMIGLLMPERIQIVEPFTRVHAVDDEGRPTSVELFVQGINRLDDPGLMIAGHVRVELYEFQPASGQPRGKLLEHWNIDLSNVKQQRLFWNRITQMYEFRLGVDPDRIPRAEKYVLSVTYGSPLGDRLTDECLLSPRDVGPGTFRARSP